MLEIIGFIALMLIGLSATAIVFLSNLINGNFGSTYTLGEHTKADKIWSLIELFLIIGYWYLVYTVSPIEINLKG